MPRIFLRVGAGSGMVQARQAVSATLRRFDSIDVLVNNAD